MKHLTYDRQLELKKEVEIKLQVCDVKEDIAYTLQHYMDTKNMSARALGIISGVSNMTIRRVLSMDQNITLDKLHRICIALEVTLSDFLSSTGYQTPEN